MHADRVISVSVSGKARAQCRYVEARPTVPSTPDGNAVKHFLAVGREPSDVSGTMRDRRACALPLTPRQTQGINASLHCPSGSQRISPPAVWQSAYVMELMGELERAGWLGPRAPTSFASTPFGVASDGESNVRRCRFAHLRLLAWTPAGSCPAPIPLIISSLFSGFVSGVSPRLPQGRVSGNSPDSKNTPPRQNHETPNPLHRRRRHPVHPRPGGFAR